MPREDAEEWPDDAPQPGVPPDGQIRPGVLRPLRKAASRLTGVSGVFSGKDYSSQPRGGAVDPNCFVVAVGDDLAFQQSVLRLDERRQRSQDANLCCGGILGPLVDMQAGGALQRLSVKAMIPWSAIVCTGFLVLCDFGMHLVLVGRVYLTNGWSSTFLILSAIFGGGAYVVCWVLGLRLALSSCANCRTAVTLPLWHRVLAAVPVLGLGVLAAYAPWLMASTTLLTVRAPEAGGGPADCL